jgi:hypothetical protein
MAANQARRRTDLDFIPPTDNGSQPQKTFIYQPLDPNPDAASIRLVLIEPSTDLEDPLSCRLIHVKFAEKRRYKALSYMWGDEAIKERMFLDGAEIYVRQNLGDALHYLRRSGNRMPLWIDAICINQQDIEERNRQLKMMKWIYFRADTVMIWLGKKYSRYQLWTKVETGQHAIPEIPDQNASQKSGTALDTTVKSEGTPETPGPNEERLVKASDEEREMVKELCVDGYWDRLWIIQEIGRAHQKEVCFGNTAMAWNGFIELVTLHNSSCKGPLRLNRLLQEKYSGSHTLRKLLQDHREALCKEPRDKIYGLVGLAADAIGFPMDYNKSLVDVWKDTMVFMNARQLLPDSDVIPFGRLVKSLLIGAKTSPLEQVLQPYEPLANSALTIEDSNSPRVFNLQGFAVGCIMAVGPSTPEIISSLQKADQWAAEIQRNFREELGEAHRENDALMRAILETDEARLASLCFSHVSNVRWVQSLRYPNELLYRYKNTIEVKQSQYSTTSQSRSQTSHDEALTSAGQSRLFLIKNCYQSKTPWKMGIASGLAKLGDLVCWIHEIERALILRVTLRENRENILQVFGTAMFTEDFGKSDKARHASRLKWFSCNESLALKIDAGTVYVLLA